MKILIEGNLIVDGCIYDTANHSGVDVNVMTGQFDEGDYDAVLVGDVKLKDVRLHGATLDVTGYVTVFGK